MPEMIDMLMPSDNDLEESILATCFVAGSELTEILDLVNAEYFYVRAHQIIFKAMLNISYKANSVDLVSVMTTLKDSGNLSEAGGATYLAKIIDAPMAVDIIYSCKKLEEKFLLRKTIEYCYATIKKCQHGQDEFDSVVDYYLESAGKISDGSKAGDPVVSMQDLAMSASDVYEKRYQEKKLVTGVASGIHELDYMTYGFHPGDFTLIAARPGMGKTALALNILRNAAIKGVGSLTYSLEMPMQQLMDRWVAIETKIDGMKVRIGDFDKHEFEKVNDAVSKLHDLPIFIDDRGGLEFNEIRKTIRRQVKAHPEIKLILIDHIQLVRGRNPQNRNLEVGDISMGFKSLAKELRLPIICLSQLNRELERRNNPYRRPKQSDLRDSGSLEQDADNVIFIYRPSVYGDNIDPKDPNCTIEIHESDCELIIAKQRQGIVGTVNCNFFDKIQTFTSRMKVSPDVLYQQRKKEQEDNE